MSKGQQAMAVAMIYPEPKKGGRGKKASKLEEFGFGAAHLSRARTVFHDAGALVDSVLIGAMTLNEGLVELCELLKALRLLEPQLGYASKKVRAVLSDAEAAVALSVADDGGEGQPEPGYRGTGGARGGGAAA